MFRCMPQGGPGEPRCTVHGADVACPRAMPALPMRGRRCRGGLRAAHAMQAPAQVACVRPCPARHASAREALARSPGRMPCRPPPMRWRGRLAACHAGPSPCAEVAWMNAMPAPAHAQARSPGRMPRRPQPMRRGRLASCHDAPAHARRGSAGPAGRCARGLAMSSGRRAQGTGEAAWRWAGPPGRCARMALPTSAAYASRRVLVLGHDIALGMSLGITLIPNANAIGAKSCDVIPC